MASPLGWKGLTYRTHLPPGSDDERFMPRILTVTSEVSPPGRPSLAGGPRETGPVCRISCAM
jgi:hypothetical protein